MAKFAFLPVKNPSYAPASGGKKDGSQSTLVELSELQNDDAHIFREYEDQGSFSHYDHTFLTAVALRHREKTTPWKVYLSNGIAVVYEYGVIFTLCEFAHRAQTRFEDIRLNLQRIVHVQRERKAETPSSLQERERLLALMEASPISFDIGGFATLDRALNCSLAYNISMLAVIMVQLKNPESELRLGESRA